jgi:ATP-dependent helicase/nuclease subunit A
MYSESTYFTKKFKRAVDDPTDSIRETDEYRVRTAAWHISTTVSTEWAKLGKDGFGQDVRSFEYLTAFADLTERALERLTEEKRTRNIIDYGDQIELARQFLTSLPAAERAEIGFFAGSPSEGAAADVADLSAYVMIDEFQDTNADQWAVIEALTSNGEGGFDARNVFLVGDDKQSIYRFRGADVSVFSETTTELTDANARNDITEPAQLDSLHTNFRTLPETLGAINGLFDRIFAPRDAVSGRSESDNSEETWYTTIDDRPAPYEARSDPLTAARVNETGTSQRIDPIVEYIPVPTTQEQRDALLPEDHDLIVEGEENEAIEARVLANRIAKMLTDGTEVYESIEEKHPDYEALQRGEDDSAPVERPRPIRPGDIAVLVPSRTQLSAYRRALRDAGVPHTVIKGSGFFETPEIKTLHTLVRVIADPRDEINLYGLLRSPIFGCTDTELAELALEGDGIKQWRLWDGLCETDSDRWASIHADLERFRKYAGVHHDHPSPEVSWAELITRVIDETGYLASVAADERGQTAVANVDEFRERMRGFDEAGVHSLAEVRYRLDHQAERESNDPEANFVAETGDDSDPGSVSIMTIHESKGMEYKAVFVPGLGRDFTKAATARLDKAIEFEAVPDGSGKTIPVFGMDGPDPDDPYTSIETIAKSLASEQRKREERAEQKRLLYVACTRARDHLVLLGQQESPSTGEDDYPAAMKPPSPTSATHWRDWVQAVLFDAPDSGGDARSGAEAAVARLVEHGRYENELTFTSATGETKSGSFSVVLPPTDHTYDSASTRVDLQLEDHTSYAAEVPAGEDVTILSLSSSDCTQLDSKRIVADGTRYKVERSDDYTGTGSHDSAIPGGLSPNVYGTVVHRLCQLTPPRDAVEDVVAQVLLEERQRGEDVDLDPDVQAVTEQAQATATRALAQIDDAIEGLDVQRRFDEYPVDVAFQDTGTLPVGRVELTGEIDHLVVTPDAYYVFDYKTDRLGNESDIETFISERTTHHAPQMAAYAAALSHDDPSRTVFTRLVYVDDALGCRVEPVSLDDPLDSFFTVIARGFENEHDDGAMV